MKEKLVYSNYQMLFFSIFATFTMGVFLNEYFLKIGFTEFHFGIYYTAFNFGNLALFPVLLWANSSDSRKKFFLLINALSMFFFLVFIILPYILRNNHSALIWGSIIALTASMTLASTGSQVIIPWLYSIIDGKRWGIFFSIRQVIGFIPMLVVTILCGQLLNNVQRSTLTEFFIIAFFCGLTALFFMNLVPEYNCNKVSPEERFKVGQLVVEVFRNKSYIAVLKYTIILSFSLGLFSPIAYKYFILDMGLNGTIISIYQSIMILASIIGYRYFGKVCDKKGNLFVLRRIGTAVIVIPLIMLILPLSKGIFVLVIFIFGFIEGYGLVFSGLFISLTGLLVEYTPERNKVFYLSFNNFMRGLAMGTGSFISGLVAENVKNLDMIAFRINGFQLLYIISLLLIISSLFVLTELQRNKEIK